MPARSEPAARTIRVCEQCDFWEGGSNIAGSGSHLSPSGGGSVFHRLKREPVVVVPVSERDQWREVAEELVVALKRRRFRHPEYPAGSHANPGHDIIAEEREVEAAFLARFDALKGGTE